MLTDHLNAVGACGVRVDGGVLLSLLQVPWSNSVSDWQPQGNSGASPALPVSALTESPQIPSQSSQSQDCNLAEDNNVTSVSGIQRSAMVAVDANLFLLAAAKNPANRLPTVAGSRGMASLVLARGSKSRAARHNLDIAKYRPQFTPSGFQAQLHVLCRISQYRPTASCNENGRSGGPCPTCHGAGKQMRPKVEMLATVHGRRSAWGCDSSLWDEVV